MQNQIAWEVGCGMKCNGDNNLVDKPGKNVLKQFDRINRTIACADAEAEERGAAVSMERPSE